MQTAGNVTAEAPPQKPKKLSQNAVKELAKIEKLEKAEREAEGAMNPEQLSAIGPLRNEATGIRAGGTGFLFVTKPPGGYFRAWWGGVYITGKTTAAQAALAVAMHMHEKGIIGQLATQALVMERERSSQEMQK